MVKRCKFSTESEVFIIFSFKVLLHERGKSPMIKRLITKRSQSTLFSPSSLVEIVRETVLNSLPKAGY